MLSKLKLLKQSPKKGVAPFILLGLLILIFIFSYIFYSYDILVVQAINECSDECYLKFILPFNEVSTIKNSKLIVDKNIVDIEDIKYEGYEEIDNVIYEHLNIKTALEDDRVYELRFLSNKQRIIKRIINSMKEG